MHAVLICRRNTLNAALYPMNMKDSGLHAAINGHTHTRSYLHTISASSALAGLSETFP